MTETAAIKSEDGFKIGDTVVLKSGGPRMTVVGLKRDHDGNVGRVECAWFINEAWSESQENSFPPAALFVVTVEFKMSNLYVSGTPIFGARRG